MSNPGGDERPGAGELGLGRAAEPVELDQEVEDLVGQLGQGLAHHAPRGQRPVDPQQGHLGRSVGMSLRSMPRSRAIWTIISLVGSKTRASASQNAAFWGSRDSASGKLSRSMANGWHRDVYWQRSHQRSQ